MRSARGSALARAALLGNPSDGFGGATLSFTFAEYAAHVTVTEAETPGIRPADPDGARLIEATVARFARHRRVRETPLAIDYRSTIPRQVGLGGSSAIVVATLRALCSLTTTHLEPDELAAVALAVEAEDLGISAGPQDRVAQAYEGLVFMDFAPGRQRHEPLDPALLPPLYVAYLREGAEHSGVLHAELRARDEADIAERMRRLAELARRGREALLEQDHAELARLIDRNLEERRALRAVDEGSAALAEAARAVGACANLAGSGGAIVGVCASPVQLESLRAALKELDAEVIAPTV
jgi:glucuronokinase